MTTTTYPRLPRGTYYYSFGQRIGPPGPFGDVFRIMDTFQRVAPLRYHGISYSPFLTGYKVYACKVIRTATLGLSASDIEAEATAIRSVYTTGNPYIIEIFSDWQDSAPGGFEAWFFVMDLMDSSLEAHMQTLSVNYNYWDFYVRAVISTDPDVYVDMQEILLGLEYLHSLGCVHRDIKPSNGPVSSLIR